MGLVTASPPSCRRTPALNYLIRNRALSIPTGHYLLVHVSAHDAEQGSPPQRPATSRCAPLVHCASRLPLADLCFMSLRAAAFTTKARAGRNGLSYWRKTSVPAPTGSATPHHATPSRAEVRARRPKSASQVRALRRRLTARTGRLTAMTGRLKKKVQEKVSGVSASATRPL